MSVKLVIKGFEIDVRPIGVKQTKQANDVSEISKRQSSFTNRMVLPYTDANVLAFAALGIEGSGSRDPYIKLPCFLSIDGMQVVENGFAVIEESNSNGIIVVVYDGIFTLAQLLGDQTLQDLDFSDLEHVKIFATIGLTQQFNLEYIYALGEFVNPYISSTGTSSSAAAAHFDTLSTLQVNGFVELTAQYQEPQLKTKPLIDRIMSHIGKTASGAILVDEDLLEEVVSTVQPTDLGDTIDFSQLMPEQKLIDFIKSWMNRYGLFLVQKGDNYEFINIDDVFDGVLLVENWTKKYSGNEKPNTDYRLTNYAQSNEINQAFNDIELRNVSRTIFPISLSATSGLLIIGRSYKIDNFVASDDFLNVGATVNATGEIFTATGTTPTTWTNGSKLDQGTSTFYQPTSIIPATISINNENLEAASELFDFVFVKERSITPDALNPFFGFGGTNEIGAMWYRFGDVDLTDPLNPVVSTTKQEDLEPRIFKLKTVLLDKYIVDGTNFGAVNTSYLSPNNSLPQFYLDTYWTSFFNALDDYKKIREPFNLTALDIKELDFKKLKFIKQLGKHYYLNKVDKFIEGRLTMVELIEAKPTSIISTITVDVLQGELQYAL